MTGSQYTGQWNNIGMSGFGTYRMPHDVQYEGELRDGMFHGDGTLLYPNGSKMFGQWVEGRMINRRYQFSDGLQYSEHNWKYCVMPDRRFRVEHVDGLRPAGRSLKTQQIPTREIPAGCFDTGDGFYNPSTKCVTCPKTGKVLRIPTNEEDQWIQSNCRRASDVNCGFRPDLYENWFDRNFVVTNDNDNVSIESNGTAMLRPDRPSDDLVTYDSELDMDVDTLSMSFFNDMAQGNALLLLERIGERSVSKLENENE